MDPSPTWHRGTFSAGLDALRAARRSPISREVVDSSRRIGHALRLAGESRGFFALSEAALAVEMTDERQITIVLDRLIAALSDLPQDSSEVMPGILIVESDAQMSKLLETILAGTDRQIFLAKSVAEAHAMVQEKAIALVVLDLQLPDADGRNFLLVLRERPATASLPVIVLSGLAGPLPKAECYALGADAFFEKPIAPEVLKAAISTRMHRSLESRREARQDVLTGLPNRAAFVETFQRVASLSERRREPTALALLDFDHLKQINEAHGYPAGDAALRQAAETLDKSLRKSDFLVRWGGDEFALLLPATSLEGARRAVGKALQTLRQNPLRLADGKTCGLSFSAGVVPVLPKTGLDATMAEADHYLFVAKASGRKRLVTEKNKDRLALPVHKILLLESDALLAQRIQESLNREGFQIHLCTDSYMAVQTLAGIPFTLCILDVDGGSREGQALFQEIHGRGRERSRVLLLTEPGREGGVPFGFQMGADDYLVKPFTAFDLMSRVHKLLKQ